MNSRLLTCLFLYFLCLNWMCDTSTIIKATSPNDRPIIGILSQELSRSLENEYGEFNYTSHIVASYVKFVEAAGARVVPIMINQDGPYYEKMIGKINGLLFPGGANFYNESGYGAAGEILLDLASFLNMNGDYFPVWGTCLGFELIIYLLSNKNDPRIQCDAWDRADPLTFLPGADRSKMFSPASQNITSILENEKVTANFHRWCVTEEGLLQSGLNSSLQVLSTSVDSAGLRYISAFESRNMPIYGVQFHPEKPLFEWNTKELSIPHSSDAITVSSYFGEFFVNEARKNTHSFDSKEEEMQYLIYNYSPTYTGAKDKVYEQTYFFY